MRYVSRLLYFSDWNRRERRHATATEIKFFRMDNELGLCDPSAVPIYKSDILMFTTSRQHAQVERPQTLQFK